MTRLRITHAPFYRSACTIPQRSLWILGAALLSLVPGILFYGMPAFAVAAVSVGSAMAWEHLFSRLTGRRNTVTDYNAALIGLLLAMMLPAGAPWWLVITGTFVAVVLGKMIFGGMGGNPFCPAALGVAVLLVSWGDYLDFDLAYRQMAENFEMMEPLGLVKYFGAAMAENYHISDLLMGRQAGGMGTVCGAGLLAGGILLMARGIIHWAISLSFLAGVAVTALCFQWAAPQTYAGPIFHLLTGYTLFGAFFLATEDSSSPVNTAAMILYGLGGGVLTVLIRNRGLYVDGVIFAVLIMNLASPLLDRIRPKALGAQEVK
ncbi:MAG: RnfABCDGE type electron transport complex subunit D [Desulfobacter sp.]|nr:MAG: RnfABCDGE type electron transport complex subunit D [Desulfobacter sp.]